MLTVAFGIIGVNAMNLYGGMLSLVTALSSGRSIAPSAILRAVLVAVIFAASILLAIVGAGNFMTNYENYLLLLLYLFIPWTAINLTDYYFVKKGSYDIDAFYDPHGVYGHDPGAHIVRGVSLPAMAASVSTKWCGQASPDIGTPRFFASRIKRTLPAALKCWQCTCAPVNSAS